MRLFSGSSDGLSLSSRLKLLTVLWVGSAFLSIAFTLLLSWRLESAAKTIEDAGSLKMQVYRLAYMASVRTPNAQIDNQIKEFERTLANVTQSDAIHPLIPSQMPLAYDLIQSMLLIGNPTSSLLCNITSGRPKSAYTVLPAISSCFYRRWKTPTSKILCGCAVFKWR